MSETMTALKPDERGRALAGEYADWLAHGNSTGSLSLHAVEGLAIHFTQALAAAEAKGRADEREACARFIEDNMLVRPDGTETVHPRTNPGNKIGLAYAAAIRSRKD